ncbi:MAG: septal ring lytic transglycosylase RlpA family protein [Alphaproteobacteria bacterium]|nr:septal ring lytic transglycosylase RlpA family protein [Alphaproteobacteria bacterium]
MLGDRRHLTALALTIVLAVTGCAETQLAVHAAKQLARLDAVPEQTPPAQGGEGSFKVGKPYRVDGVWYYPRIQPDYDETGVASWYGEPFHGESTANGEIYDMNALTAAHQTLPLPSVVRVTNLENGRGLVLRVNDRGPFVNGRIIDVSRRAAQLLGFHGKGTAKVRVQVLDDAALRVATANDADPETAAFGKASSAARERAQRKAAVLQAKATDAAPPETEPELYVQAGAYRREDNAVKTRDRVSAFGAAKISTVVRDGVTLFRVRIGPLESVGQADGVLDSMLDSGITDARIIVGQ